jgi:ribosomal protein S18 acetylase RimI-like enzyme
MTTSSLTIESARPSEHAEAFRLAFQHLSQRDQTARVATALELVRKKEIEPAGILVARLAGRLVGSLICMTTPGAGGLLWPPQVLPGSLDRTDVEDRLIQQATLWLRGRGAKLAQAMLVPDEIHLAGAFPRNGFPRITTLSYLRRDLEEAVPEAGQSLTYQLHAAEPALFEKTLLRTYEQTLDCPELSGAREIAEIIEGHRAQGVHDPGLWWLALADGQPVGVLLVCQMPEWNSWDVSYVGVVAEARRRGFGTRILAKAMREAKHSLVPQLTLSVDQRNRAALKLYENLGFEPFDQREVYLAVWSPGLH